MKVAVITKLTLAHQIAKFSDWTRRFFTIDYRYRRSRWCADFWRRP